ncbi:hypothetical protein GCM10022253_28310 [Sphingomonas endophytica]|jgi:hypothetical protein|uniref:Uncharacterized protein n=1 Tax=Sphingomonas endophytica TaxID=869719 RepID=A0A7X0JA59_9SPHN|nr:hypothetical protein [Sphingomonas endophytica]MBB5727135.1 hypothetical protein [Sphingomonas endophytica]MBB6503879.1 hypothetical protein [Sphingomonas endophytica]
MRIGAYRPFGWYAAAVAQFEIAIASGWSVSATEEHQNIEVARDATIRTAIDRMLDAASGASSQVANCMIVGVDDDQERSFSITLSIIDYI